MGGNNEKADYATRTRLANEERLRQSAVGNMNNRSEENMRKRKWEKTRDDRVLGWRTFLHKNEEGDFKNKAYAKVGKVAAGNVHHKREENEKKDPAKDGPAGIQREWKDTWR